MESADEASHSHAIAIACVCLNVVELCVHILTVAVDILFAHLIFNTSILHRNLKAIFCAQVVQMLGFSATRVWPLFVQLMRAQLLWMPPTLFYMAGLFFLIMGHHLGHALMAERIFCTVQVHNYEHQKHWKFTLTWCIIVISVPAVYSYIQAYLTAFLEINDFNFYIFSVAVAISFIEIFILWRLMRLNEQKFRASLHERSKNTLSAKYQMTENVRTCHQLAPTFVCHFVGITFTFFVVLTLKFQISGDFETIALICTINLCVLSLSNLVMLLSAITFHPLLNRSANRILVALIKHLPFIKLLNNNAVNPAPDSLFNLPMRNGATLNEQDVHFNDLRKMWGDA